MKKEGILCFRVIFAANMLVRKYISVTTFLLCALMNPVLYAQQTWSLQQCIDQALQNNIAIKQRIYNLKSSEADLLQSKINILPSINGQLTNNFNTGFSINPVTNQTLSDATFRSNNFILSGSMTLFSGFQNTNAIRQQQVTVKAAEEDVQATKNNIVLAVANAFMAVLMNEEVLKARELQMASTKEQLQRQQKLFELGGSNKVRLLQIKAQLANEELQLVTAQNQLQQSYLTLWQAMNINPDSSNKIVWQQNMDNKVEDEIRNANQIYEVFKQNSPELKAAHYRTRAAEINQFIAQGGRSFRINMNGGLNSFYTTQSLRGKGDPVLSSSIIGVDGSGNLIYSIPFPRYTETEITPFNTQFDRNLGKSLGFNVSIPILNGWQTNNAIQKARINQEITKLSEKQTQLDVYRNINQAYLDFKAAQKQYEASKLSYDANKEAYDLANSQFTLGAINANDYIASKNQFLSAETSLLQAKYQLMFRRKVLDFYLGKPLN